MTHLTAARGFEGLSVGSTGRCMWEDKLKGRRQDALSTDAVDEACLNGLTIYTAADGHKFFYMRNPHGRVATIHRTLDDRIVVQREPSGTRVGTYTTMEEAYRVGVQVELSGLRILDTEAHHRTKTQRLVTIGILVARSGFPLGFLPPTVTDRRRRIRRGLSGGSCSSRRSPMISG